MTTQNTTDDINSGDIVEAIRVFADLSIEELAKYATHNSTDPKSCLMRLLQLSEKINQRLEETAKWQAANPTRAAEVERFLNTVLESRTLTGEPFAEYEPMLDMVTEADGTWAAVWVWVSDNALNNYATQEKKHGEH
jgi:hypothetical protein